MLNLSMKSKMLELYHRTARLDLDDYNNEVHEGCHITSMAGSWMAVVEGFGGMRITDDKLSFSPSLPSEWDNLEFTIRFRERKIRINIRKEVTSLRILEGEPLEVIVDEQTRLIR